MKQRTYSLPDEIHQAIKKQLQILKADLSSPKKIAQMVHSLSNRYTQKSDLDNIWANQKNQIAYISYFFVLNSLRIYPVIEEAMERGFFKGLDRFIDFGSGCGTIDLALGAYLKNSEIKEGYFIETSQQAIALHKSLLDQLDNLDPKIWIKEQQASQIKSSSTTLATFSYSLNEVKSLPQWTLNKEALLIIEPSTSRDSRKLLEVRKQLVNAGYYIWAPCLHQKNCPLLTHSKKDWCHDRIFTDLPNWFLEMENHLPIKNRTVTFSYLLARKSPSSELFTGQTRVIGDTQKEKGKSKQMVCHGTERLFLSWLKKMGEPPQIPRGTITQLSPNLERKGDELRVSKS